MASDLPFSAPKRKQRVNLAESLAPSTPNPLADVEYTGDLEKDSAAELTATLAGFKARRSREDRRFTAATDSEFWFAVCFRSREDKEAFLAALPGSGGDDKYLDGYELAARLGIELEG